MLSSAFVVSSKLQYMSIISNLEMNKKPSLFIMTVSELNGAVCLHLKYMLNKATAPLLEHVSGVCLCACVQDMQWGPDIQNLPIKTSLEHFHIKLEKMDKQVYDEWLILLVIKNMQRDQCSPSPEQLTLLSWFFSVNKTLMNQSGTLMIESELLTELTFCQVQFRKKIKNESINQ